MSWQKPNIQDLNSPNPWLRVIACVVWIVACSSSSIAQDDLPPRPRSKEKSSKFAKQVPGNEPARQKLEFTRRVGVIYDKCDDYQLACDIYQPEGKGPFPAVVAIHGGAWRHGNKLQMLRHCWKLASSGYVVVAINYRLAPDNKFPSQVYDAKTAVQWMRFKAEKLKIDPKRIAAFGYSAGAHLAAMLGTTDTDDGFENSPTNQRLKDFSSRVQCVIAGGAPCEFDWIKSRALVYWLGNSPEDNPRIYERAAPTSFISKDDPPFLFIHGSADKVVPIDSSKKMHKALQTAGVRSHHKTIDGKGHFATFSDLSWMDTVIDFMDDVMAEKNAQ